MPWSEATVMNQKKEFIDHVQEGKISIAECCKMFSISRKTGYKWISRYKSQGFEGLLELARAPRVQARAIDEKIVGRVLEVRYRWPSMGPRKVRAWLMREFPQFPWPAASTIGNIFKRYGLSKPQRQRKRVPATAPFSKCTLANDTWCMDFKGSFKTQDGAYCAPLTVTDAHTRYLLSCTNLRRNDTSNVWGVFERLFREFGLPKRIRSDNGPPFGSVGAGRLTHLAVKLIKAGVTPEWIHPGRPEENGRHERFHRTLKAETANPPANNLLKQQERFSQFQVFYNFERPHESLNNKRPCDVYTLSSRRWSGRLISLEYDSKHIVSQVRSCGKFLFKGRDIYVGRVLASEQVGLVEEENGWAAYFGPIYLGRVDKEYQLIKPKLQLRKRRKLV